MTGTLDRQGRGGREDVVGVELPLEFAQAGRVISVCVADLLMSIGREEVRMTAQKCGRCESLRKIIHRRWIAASTRALGSQAAIISTMKCFRRMAKAVVSAATCVPTPWK